MSAGLRNPLERMYLANLGNEQVRQILLPVAAGPTLTANGAGSTYGIWADVVLHGAITVPTLIVAVQIHHGSANDEFTVDIGTSLSLGVNYFHAATVTATADPAIIQGAHRQEIGVHISAATTPDYLVKLYSPIIVHPDESIIARCYGITAAAVTICVRVMLLQAY